MTANINKFTYKVKIFLDKSKNLMFVFLCILETSNRYCFSLYGTTQRTWQKRRTTGSRFSIETRLHIMERNYRFDKAEVDIIAQKK